MKYILLVVLSLVAVSSSAGVLANNVCRGRTELVEATLQSIGNAANGVALKAKGYKGKEAMSVDEGVALVDQNAATNSGFCVYKTMIRVLQNKGEVGSEIIIEDSGDDIALLVRNINDGQLVVYKNAGEVADFARRSLTSYLYDVQRSYEPTLKERCEELDRMPKFPGYTMPDYCAPLLKK